MPGRDLPTSPDDFGPFASVDREGYSIKQQFARVNVMVTGPELLALLALTDMPRWSCSDLSVGDYFD